MASSLIKTVSAKPVKPILSTSGEEAKRNVINLYRAWCRELPRTLEVNRLDISLKQARTKLREEFMKNAHVRDVRVIDLLVVKGRLELHDTYHVYKQRSQLMTYFHETKPAMKTDFLSKFYEGNKFK